MVERSHTIRRNSPISYRYFIVESLKITLFSLGMAIILSLLGVSQEAILTIFCMVVMSAAATFSPQKDSLYHITLGSIVVVLSIIIGGLAGFYFPLLSKLLTIIYAGLAFLLPKTRIKRNMFTTSAVMFLIFTALPFDLNAVLTYLVYGAIVIVGYTILTYFFDKQIHNYDQTNQLILVSDQKTTALIVTISLLMAWMISYFLSLYSTISHLYWIALTVIVVIQVCQENAIFIAIKRIVINLIGAIIIVFLFNYVIPADFWYNFLLLTLFLFLIFALGFSYNYRTLFIEMFVLGISHMLGSYQDAIAVDRVILTTIGGCIVIITILSLRLSVLVYSKSNRSLMR